MPSEAIEELKRFLEEKSIEYNYEVVGDKGCNSELLYFRFNDRSHLVANMYNSKNDYELYYARKSGNKFECCNLPKTCTLGMLKFYIKIKSD